MPSPQRSEPLDLSGRRVFITGGTGYVGRTLLDYIEESVAHHGTGPSEVCVLSRDPALFLNRFPRYAALPWLRFHRGEVTSFAWPDGPYTDVIHAAADTHRAGRHAEWVEQIVGGTRRTLDFAANAGCERFLLTSSGAVYGPQPSGMARVAEDYDGAPSPLALSSVYGQAKRLAEQLCTIYREERGLGVVIARCFALIGEHIPLDGPYAVGDFLSDALLGRPIRIRGDGHTVRSYLYGRDMAHWIAMLLSCGEAGEAYNVGSDQAFTLFEVAEAIRDRVNPGGSVHVEHGEPLPQTRSVYVPSISKAETLGLRVETSLPEAIEISAAMLRASALPIFR